MMKRREMEIVEISDDDLLYRRIPPTDFRLDGSIVYSTYTKSEQSEPGQPKRAVPDPEISVDLASRTTKEWTVAAGHSRKVPFGLGELTAGEVRALGFTVRHQPTRENKAHCLIEGLKTETDCAMLRDITRIIIRPETISDAQ